MHNCRGCGRLLHQEDAFCDLGFMPNANALLDPASMASPELRYPIRPLVCRGCLLVQLPSIKADSIFTDNYPFFAGQSAVWIAHCKKLAKQLQQTYKLGPTSRVLEIGSNDGTLLRCFRGLDVPAVGVEPCVSVAQHATMEGLATIKEFWGYELANDLLKTQGVPTAKSWRADLVIGTNVLAHVPDLADFLIGIRTILAPGGAAVFEVPYLGDMMAQGQFDQIYTEHYSYFSLNSLKTVLERCGMHLRSVEFLPTHGGSIRIHAGVGAPGAIEPRLLAALDSEHQAGWCTIKGLKDFALEPPQAKRTAWSTIIDAARGAGPNRHVSIIGYGASAKAAVMLNYCGMGPETISTVADTTPAKWGKFIPGVRIPIVPPEQAPTPDVVVNFAWNWKKESEANIRKAWPRALIIYLKRTVSQMVAAA